MLFRLPLLSFLIFFAASACLPSVGSTQSGSRAADRIVYGLTLQPSGFDPHINRSSELGIPLRQVYDTLVYRHPETQALVPGLAREWTVSENGLVYTFKLRSDVVFHDGTPFNAAAVAANLDRIVAPETASQLAAFLLGPYSGYTIIDEQTIALQLTEPFSPFLDSLAQVYLGIASPVALSAYSTSRYQFHQVGTGPFKFIEFVPGDRIILERNPDYAWGPEFYAPASPQSVQSVEFRFFTDPPTRALALESGEAQIMGELLPTDARVLTASSALQLLPTAVPGQPLQFLMNTQRFPTDSRGVRQALIFGANRNAIADAVFQQFSPVAWGPLTADALYYDRGMRGLYAHDITQAQALLEAAGFSDADRDGFVDIAGVTVAVDVIVPPWGLLPEVTELLQDQWRTIGVRAVLQPVPTFGALLEAVESGRYNLVAFNTYGLDPVFLNDFFLSDGTNNWTGYASEELDALLHEAEAAGDDNVRRGLYARIQQQIMNEALILPIRDQVNLNAASAALRGLQYDAYGWFPLFNNVERVGG
jgi:peptide/nickel transport system substrate-binding protein